MRLCWSVVCLTKPSARPKYQRGPGPNLDWTRPPLCVGTIMQFRFSSALRFSNHQRIESTISGWAYLINDDRYDYVLQSSLREKKKLPPKTIERAPRFSLISAKNLQLASYSALPTEFASVALNDDGQVFVHWLNPEYAHHLVNIGAVMNRGAYCVP